jgi:prolycopene isomerase
MTAVERMKNKLPLLKFAMPFIPYISYTGEKGLKKGLNKFFKDEKLHKIFTGETELLSCLVPIGWAYYGDFQSPPVGGGQVLPEWMEHVVKYYGNDIIYKAAVSEVVVENNTAKGVKFTHFNTNYIVNCKYVVAACDIETLYEKMLPQHAIPTKLKDKLKDADIYSSSVTVSIALDCTPDKLGFNEELVHIVTENAPTGEQCDGNPHTSEISILAPSFRDPSLAPEGCGTLTLFMPAFIDYSNEWETDKDDKGNYKRGEAYKQLKNEIADIIIQRVEDMVAPGLRSHILFYDVATPVTHWRYTGNRGGTMMGAKPGKKNMQNKIAHYQTPVNNLLLGGHWAELGGGVPIAVKAGANAALLIFKKEKPEAFQLMAGYMDGKIPVEVLHNAAVFKPYANDWKQEPTPAQKATMRSQSAD